MVTSVMARLRWVGLSFIILFSTSCFAQNTTLVCKPHSSVFLRCADNFTAHIDVQPVITNSGVSVTCEGPFTIICEPQPPMAWAIVQHVFANQNSGSTSQAATITSTTNGNGLIVIATASNWGTPTITDNKGSTYTAIGNQQASSSSGIGAWYLANIPSGITTITISNFNFSGTSIEVIEVSGGNTSTFFDQWASSSNGFGQANPQLTGTTAALAATDDLLIIGFFEFRTSNNTTYSTATNYTVLDTNSAGTGNYQNFQYWANPGSSAAQSASVNANTTAGGSQTLALILAFRSGGAAPSGGLVPYMRTPVGFGMGF